MSQRVNHSKYGNGTVVGQISGSFMLLVKFDNGITFYVRKDETQKIEEYKDQEAALPEAKLKNIDQRSPQDAAFIENLRLGISPNDVSNFTFGRDSELSQIDDLINRETSNSIIISGDYGSGKSHLIECIKQKYLNQGFAVSSFQLDPNECPLHKPRRVYSKIVKMISAQRSGKIIGLRELMKEYAIRRFPPLENEYLDHVMEICQNDGSLSELAFDWIEGEGPYGFSSLPLYDDAPSANIYCSILGGITKLVRNFGFKGLIIMLDEAEQLRGSWYAQYQFLKGINFFAGLSLSASASPMLDEKPRTNPNPPPTIFGPKSGLPYSARKTIKYHEPLSPTFKMIFAFTNLNFLQGVLLERLGKPTTIQLTQLEDNAKEDLLDALYAIYKRAYPSFNYDNVSTLIDDLISSSLYSENVRILNKAFIEALDIIRYRSLSTHRGFLS